MSKKIVDLTYHRSFKAGFSAAEESRHDQLQPLLFHDLEPEDQSRLSPIAWAAGYKSGARYMQLIDMGQDDAFFAVNEGNIDSPPNRNLLEYEVKTYLMGWEQGFEQFSFIKENHPEAYRKMLDAALKHREENHE